MSFKLGEGEQEHDGRRFTDADEPTLRGWFDALPGVVALEVWLTDDQRPGRADRWVNALATRALEPERRLVTGGDDPFLPRLSSALARATEASLAVAFVKTTGLRLLLPDLEALLDADPPGRVRVLTSDYLDVTDPEALRLLLPLAARGAEVRVHVTRGDSFHLKAYVFSERRSGELVRGTACVGSSNLSRQALEEGLEWSYRVVHPADAGFLEVSRRFDELFGHPRNVPLSDAWIEPSMRAAADRDPAWVRYWRRNPINAWLGGNRAEDAPAPFTLDGVPFRLTRPVEPALAPALTSMLQELVEQRLAAY